jgi:hypothetical protein
MVPYWLLVQYVSQSRTVHAILPPHSPTSRCRATLPSVIRPRLRHRPAHQLTATTAHLDTKDKSMCLHVSLSLDAVTVVHKGTGCRERQREHRAGMAASTRAGLPWLHMYTTCCTQVVYAGQDGSNGCSLCSTCHTFDDCSAASILDFKSWGAIARPPSRGAPCQ